MLAPRNGSQPGLGGGGAAPAFSSAAIKRIQSDYKEIKRYPIEGVAVEMREDAMGKWDVFLEGPRGTPFEGGIYHLELSFPPNYPEHPPTLRFLSSFYHPNVYPDGRVCISILHAPGDDQLAGETFDIRWKPINSVSSVLSSLLLMLMEPNFSSPANVDASVEWRNDPAKYVNTAKALATRAQAAFSAQHSDVFIPHPDTNPGERLINEYEEKKPATVEVWDSDSGEQDEWGSEENDMDASD